MPQESNALCTDRPSVSIVIACRNEEAHIVNCIESLVDEFTQQECEFVIADGMSTDRTFEIIRELQARYHNIRLFRNVGIIQACGLNLAIDQCAGDVVVRADAHCTYPEEYVKTCVARHRDSGAANLGGLMSPLATGHLCEAVCAAMKHPAGIGNNHFHLGDYYGAADTVYLGTFCKDLLLGVGKYDPAAHPAEDAELNYRIRQSGGLVMLDSSIQVSYRPRSSFPKLARQFRGYAHGRAYMAQKHPSTLSVRHILAPVLALALMCSAIGAIRFPAALALPVSYLIALFVVSMPRRGVRAGARVLLPFVLATMHLSWGYGFLVSSTELFFQRCWIRVSAPALHVEDKRVQ